MNFGRCNNHNTPRNRLSFPNLARALRGLAVGLAMAPAPVLAQLTPGTPQSNQVSARPLDLLVGNAVLEYERKLSPYVGLSIVPKLLFGRHTINYGGVFASRSYQQLGFDIEGGVQIYVTKSGLRGVFINPSVGFRRLSYQPRGGRLSQLDMSLINGRLKAGYRWISASGLVLTAAGGVQGSWGWGNSDFSFSSFADHLILASHAVMIFPDVALGIGYAF